MKNTLNRGKIQILIYKNKEGFIGVCYETGFVHFGETEKKVRDHITNSTIALLQTIEDGDLSIKAINQKPAIKYRILFFLFPILSSILRLSNVSFFTEPINPRLLSNA